MPLLASLRPSLRRALALAAPLALFACMALATDAAAAPTARFTATPVQQPVCVAPCAVHLDARATDDPQYTRDFHTLDYEFSCGIAAAGRAPGTWQDGASRDVARGPITGCVYGEPGTYRIDLTVRAPDGESDTESATVVVTDPNAEFNGANETWCIADSGTPGGPAFAACPNANSANHVVTTNFGSGLQACGATNAHRRCLFRAGDAFTVTSSTALSDAGGLVGRYDAGAPPAMSGSSDRGLALGDDWTVTGLVFTLTDDQGLPCGSHSDYLNLGTAKNGITLHDIDLNGLSAHGVSTSSGMGTGVTHNDRIALIDVSMTASPTFGVCGGALFLRSERTLVIGNVLDGAGRAGDATTYNFRTVHFPYGAVQHNRIRRPGPQDNNIQLRAWASTTTGPPNDPTQYVVISDNQFSAQNPTMGFIRTCQANRCENTPTNYTNNQHVLIERNFFSLEPGGTTQGMALIAHIQGGDTTVRNNVVDAQGVDFSARGSTSTLVTHTANGAAGLNGDRIHVLNNTLYSDDAGPRNVRLCSSGDVGTGHECHGNLVYVPNNTGTDSATSGSGWSTPRNNVFAGANPFAATPPAQGATTAASFELAATSSAKDAGEDFGGVTAYANVRDQAARCRPANATNFDAGAREQGAAACASSQPPPVAVCGNGARETGEACDDGNLVAGDGCNAVCAVEACGNATRDAGEACDDGNLAAGDGCNAVCRVEACGNGTRDAGEACDDGNLASGDGCSATCVVELPPACGNGTRDAGEACDDGNVASGDGCSATCVVELPPPVCGNGVHETGEACDDGNLALGDGCRPDCSAEVCGDGVRDAAEACDDGNLVGGDGCRPGCTVEACGDGVLDGNEGCDDGGAVAGDGCSASCALEDDPTEAGEYWVDAGGAGYLAGDGAFWVSDAVFANGGRVATATTGDVRSTNDDPLYRSRRYAPAGQPLVLEFPVHATGPFLVRLHFAELDGPMARAGNRVFDVVAEDAFTVADIDVYQRAGWSRAYVKSFYVNVDDGALTLRLVPKAGEPMISAVEIHLQAPPGNKPRFVER